MASPGVPPRGMQSVMCLMREEFSVLTFLVTCLLGLLIYLLIWCCTRRKSKSDVYQNTHVVIPHTEIQAKREIKPETAIQAEQVIKPETVPAVNLEPKRMAEEDIRKCLEYIFSQQGKLETAPFGLSKSGVSETASMERSWQRDILGYNMEIDKLLQKYKVQGEDVLEIKSAYDSLQNLSTKRSSCLEVISGIASLEDQIVNLSSEFDARAVHLVNMGDNNKQRGGKAQTNESMVKTAQNCVVAVRNNWRWINTVLQCTQIHLKNAALYHQFFHEADEAEYWMNTTMSRMHLTFDRTNLKGDRGDVKVIMDEMKDTLLAYLQWQGKVDNLHERAKDIVPVRERVEAVAESRPVLALTDYKTTEIEFIEGEALTLKDNSNKQKWLVETVRGQTCMVPSVVLLLPAPSSDAVDVAVRLRVQLLSLWTTSIKRLGYQMIAFMLIVFKDWTEEECMKTVNGESKIEALQTMDSKSKMELLRILQYIEDTLLKNWNGYGDFEALQEKILRLRMILEDSPDEITSSEGSELLSTVVVQVQSLEDLLKKYQDFWTYWETFRVIVELLRQPKYLLVSDKWDELRYITTAHFVKFWDTNLDVQGEDITKAESSMTLFETPKAPLPAPEPRDEGEDIALEQTQTTTSTDQVQSSVEEERQTFVIKAVIDPRDESMLTLQEANSLGIIDQASRKYIHPETKEVLSFADAMNEGWIIVEFKSRKKIKEEKKSFGIVTIQTTKENRDYTIRKVKDPKTEEELTVSQATSKKILDTSRGVYVTDEGEEISIMDAIHSGLIIADFHQNGNTSQKPEVVTKTYAVHGVRDSKLKRQVSFNEAATRGLISRDTGNYIDNETGKEISVKDAIMKGYVKARVVTDPKKLDVDPENKIVIEKFSSAKTKITKALKASKAFEGSWKK